MPWDSYSSSSRICSIAPDGQLARRRGTSTRLGRALDGSSDGLRFLNLGVHLVIRLVLSSGWTLDHGDSARGRGVVQPHHAERHDRFHPARLPRAWQGQGQRARMSMSSISPRISRGSSASRPASTRATRSCRPACFRRRSLSCAPRATSEGPPHPWPLYRARLQPLLSWCPWLGQNIRFIVLGVTAVAGWPAGLLWITVLPMNLITVALVSEQERRAGAILRGEALAAPPSPASPPTPPAVPIGGN